MNIENLTSNEIESLDEFIEKKQKKFIMLAVGMILIGIIVSIIPISFLPRSGRFAGDVDTSVNAIQSFGFVIWAIFFIVVVGGLIAAAYADSRLYYLKKDKIDLEKVHVKAYVNEILISKSQNIYQVIFKAENIKKIRLNLNSSAIKNYKVGQEENLTVLKNSRIQLKAFHS